MQCLEDSFGDKAGLSGIMMQVGVKLAKSTTTITTKMSLLDKTDKPLMLSVFWEYFKLYHTLVSRGVIQ